MATVESFPTLDDTYTFEPPINVGAHVVNTIGKIIALAAYGTNASGYTIESAARVIDYKLGLMRDIGGSEMASQFLTDTASMGEATYTITRQIQ